MTPFKKFALILLSIITLNIHAQMPEMYPDASGGFFGVDYTRTEHLFNFPGFKQSDELDFIGIKLGLVQNHRFYFKLSGGAGYAARSDTRLQGPLAFSENPDNENGFNLNGSVRFGYNFDLGSAFRIRPVIGYKIDHVRFKLDDIGGNVDMEYTWQGYSYGLEADLDFGNVVLFAGFDFFEASPDVSTSNDALGGGAFSTNWDGDGTEFHVGLLTRIDDGILFLRAFRQSWSADGDGGASWDVTNTGVMFGGGFGF